MFSFVTFMHEDEHKFNLGVLMHVKCIHELCSLLLMHSVVFVGKPQEEGVESIAGSFPSV